MLDGKVALITGGSRGQGRAHAVTSAREGADVIIVDIAEQMSTVPYPMARQGDLDETVKLVEAYDRRALAIKADVRSQQRVDRAHLLDQRLGGRPQLRALRRGQGDRRAGKGREGRRPGWRRGGAVAGNKRSVRSDHAR
jgi:NAD(P)-dependent dehydrogenase (short-subunit alcohol dehydrogenase family)